MTKSEWIEKLDRLGTERIPSFFFISFDKQKAYAEPLSQASEKLLYKVRNIRNYQVNKPAKQLDFRKNPIPFEQYASALEAVKEEIRSGNTYLLNLTFQTPIFTNYSLREIFLGAKAKFKLMVPERFVCFSPEPFIEISDDIVRTYPMKGTIDANLPDAEAKILSDPKETAEHVMIVDLMRNDLGMIGTKVRVERFRYVERIIAGNKTLLQVSSQVKARLRNDWHKRLGTLLDTLLPAGSISGTPKKKTVEIITRTEDYDRGFYTGVFGLFDGRNLSSGVMIRFIEQTPKGLVYKSGGGITIDSDAVNEYTELIDKIYIPL